MNHTERRGRWLYAPVAALALAVVLPLACLLVGVWLAGWRLEMVRTASMEPTYPVGSMTVVEPVDASQVREGMALSFTDPDGSHQVVTHRVIRVIRHDSGLFFETQGDANATPDPQLVPARNARGRVRWHVPYFGEAAWALRWPRAPLALVAAPGLLLAAGEVRAWRRRRNTDAVTGPVAGEPAGSAISAQAVADAIADQVVAEEAVSEALAACRSAVDAVAEARTLVFASGGDSTAQVVRPLASVGDP